MLTSASHSASTARCLGCTTVCFFAMVPPSSGAMASSSRSRSSNSSACLLQAISSDLLHLGSSAIALFSRAASAIAAQRGHLRLTVAAHACAPSSLSQGAAHRARPRSRKSPEVEEEEQEADEEEEEGAPANERISMMQSLGRSAKVAAAGCDVDGPGLIGGVSGSRGARARLGESIVVFV